MQFIWFWNDGHQSFFRNKVAPSSSNSFHWIEIVCSLCWNRKCEWSQAGNYCVHREQSTKQYRAVYSVYSPYPGFCRARRRPVQHPAGSPTPELHPSPTPSSGASGKAGGGQLASKEDWSRSLSPLAPPSASLQQPPMIGDARTTYSIHGIGPTHAPRRPTCTKLRPEKLEQRNYEKENWQRWGSWFSTPQLKYRL
jgi:hypothetical protein